MKPKKQTPNTEECGCQKRIIEKYNNLMITPQLPDPKRPYLLVWKDVQIAGRGIFLKNTSEKHPETRLHGIIHIEFTHIDETTHLRTPVEYIDHVVKFSYCPFCGQKYPTRRAKIK